MRKSRSVCLLIAVFLLLPVFISCEREIDGESIDSTDDGEVSEDTTEHKQIKADIDALYSSGIDRSKAMVNIAQGKSYSVSYNASNDYPDDGTKLTDGVFAENYYGASDKTNWAGFNTRLNVKDLEIELDLGKEHSEIADIGMSFCGNITYGIGLPGEVEFYVSGSDDNYVMIGKAISPEFVSANTLYSFELKLQEGITASKIKMVCKEPKSSWLFIDEIYVYKYEGEGSMIDQPSNYYGEEKIKEVTEPTYWSDSESDYNEDVNLLKGLTPKFFAMDAISGELATEQYNTLSKNSTLTDGLYSTRSTYADGRWTRFTRGLARDIVFDLKNTSAVSGYTLGFLKEDETGVRLPNYVSISASEDGVGWQEIAYITGFVSEKEKDIIRKSGSFKDTYRARYIKISFPIFSHIYADEFEINGRKNASGAKKIVPSEKSEDNLPGKYAAPEDFNNINDVLLSYICHPDIAPISKEIYLPHVAYIEDGKIKDTLFDSYMFLPYVAYLYENGKKRPLKKEDWQHYIDVQYTNDGNMDALEAAVEETKSALDLKDYKVGVFLSILYPVTTQTNFGEINGKNLDFSKTEDRKAAIKWIIDEQERIFKEKGYENLYIEGFYWFTEEVDYSDEGLMDMLSFTTDYVRELGYITTWIPYYQASGYNEWQKFGFDLACYQPNYAFNKAIPDQRLFDAAKAAKMLGMCIELEIGGSSDSDVDRLKKYFAVGAATGYMTEAIHMYYQGGVPGSIYNAYKSNDGYIHSLYKDTYKFIKGKFSNDAPGIEDRALECAVSDKVSGTLTVESDNYVKGFVLATSPKYGTVQLNPDGSFIYTPFTGITGEDFFEVSVNYGYDVSEPSKFTVNIK